MKLKEIFYAFGLRPPTRTYGHAIEELDLAEFGQARFARWLHPKTRPVTPQVEEVRGLRKFLREGDTCLDIGAHVGDTALPMALAVGATGAVIAAEPNPHVFKVLEVNAGLNPQQGRILPLPFAATEEDGELTFTYSDPGYCNGGDHTDLPRHRHGHFFPLKVQGRNLLPILQEEFAPEVQNLRFIKVDTEGHDHAALRTLEPLLRTRQPYIRAEVYLHLTGEEREAFLAYLQDLAYTVHIWQGGEDPIGPRLTLSHLMGTRHFDLIAVPA